MDVVYVLIGFVCGFLCDAYIHFSKWKREKMRRKIMLMDMTEKEIMEQGAKVTLDMVAERRELLENENN